MDRVHAATGDPLFAGTVEGANVQMSTNDTVGWQGTVVYRLAGFDGGWVGTFQQVWAFDKEQLT